MVMCMKARDGSPSRDVFILTEGEISHHAKDIPHAVFGEERFKMQLIVSF